MLPLISSIFPRAPLLRSFNFSLQCLRQVSCSPMTPTIHFLHPCLTLSMRLLSMASMVRPWKAQQPPSPGSFGTVLMTAENPYLVYAILKYKDRFEAVRAFTLESGQQEIECQREKRKAGDTSGDLVTSPTLSHSEEDLHAPSGARSPLTRIPEENSAFAIGDDDSDDEAEGGGPRTPSQSSPSAQTSRRPSFASTTDETSSQIRGISEKARGKLPAGRPSVSRQNSMTSQTSMSALFSASSTGFVPTVAWVRVHRYHIPYNC